MAFQPLPPELVQKALQIAGSYNANNTAPMKRAASALEKAGRKGDTELVHVTPGELSLLETIGSGTTNPLTGLREFFRGDQQSKDVEGRGEDPMGMEAAAEAAAEATRGMSDEERTEAAEEAIEDMERELRDSDRDEDDRAIQRLIEEEMLAQTQENIRETQRGLDADRAAAAATSTETKTAAEALEQARGKQKERGVLALAALEAAERAARPTAPVEEKPTPVEQAIEQATTPIDFYDPATPAQRGGLYSSALAPTQPTYLQDTALNNLTGGPTPSASPAQLSTTANVDEPVDAITPAQEVQANLSLEQQQANLAAAEADLASAQFATPPTFGMAAGKPRISQAGIVGGIADAIFNPEATLANAISERGIGSLNGQPVDTVDGVDTGRQKGALEVVQVDGRTAAYDPDRNIVYDTDPFKGVNPFGDERVPEGIQALYDKKRAVDELKRDSDRDDREPVTEEEVVEDNDVDEAAQLPPTIDIVPFRPEDFYYFRPGNFAYNRGIPSMMNMRTR